MSGEGLPLTSRGAHWQIFFPFFSFFVVEWKEVGGMQSARRLSLGRELSLRFSYYGMARSHSLKTRSLRAPYTCTELSYLWHFLPQIWGRFLRAVYLCADCMAK